MTILPDFGGQRFGVIYADPPWLFSTWSARGKGRSAENHYPCMTLQDLWAFGDEVKRIAADDSVLFMWATFPHLEQALKLMVGWGFTYKTVGFTWIKVNADGKPSTGLGYWTRANAEICLLGTRGSPARLSADVGQVVIAPRGRHSAKPADVRRRIERLVGGPFLELFARDRAPNWSAWGNEVSDDEDAAA